ncbi:hypothetical protein RCL_jg5499.t1 [Rhizophagus clarus]|uniref:Uncharacterized protein n=1 Tax=Rhizophagus clarus TaxID=94130 RepID=A0A8H3M445_9GLOM|nr:hypothetical protein RCL_jg5499.t1 [Rhizophagus clarus]
MVIIERITIPIKIVLRPKIWRLNLHGVSEHDSLGATFSYFFNFEKAWLFLVPFRRKFKTCTISVNIHHYI